MADPAVWDNDPACGHDVTCAFQTHYCTYIRVPQLLTLQSVPPDQPEHLWLVTLYQWYELWFRVLLADITTAIRDDGTTYEPVKLLNRGIELYKLMDIVTDLAETVVVRELRVKQQITPGVPPDPRLISDQFSELLSLAPHLARLEGSPFPGLDTFIGEYQSRLDLFATRFHRLVAATLEPVDGPAPSYGKWLQLPELLTIQNAVKAGWHIDGSMPTELMLPETISPDELMFVVVHQCFEIWFKVMLDQIDRAIAALQQDDLASAWGLLHRALLVQRMLVSQIRIPATMQPLDFMRFRRMQQEAADGLLVTGLSPASGTESYQFREIEIVCGLRDDPVFNKYLQGTDKLPIRLRTRRQAERLQQATLARAFEEAARRRGITQLEEMYRPSDVPNPNADLARVADLLVDFDEFFHLWRINHVTMVEKMIGAKSGTGFLGPEYLMETAGIRTQEHNRIFEERQVRPRFFDELWQVRTRLGEP